MSDSFHGVALAEKISEADVSVFDFKFFDDNGYLSPLGFIDDAISTFTDLVFD